jgi:hypothetical protein
MVLFYQLDYMQVGGRSAPLYLKSSSGAGGWVSTARSSVGGFASILHLGMWHIAEDTDHLLFLLALLLPPPLVVFGSRWAGFGGLRHCLLQILKVVSAFTVGHSITLALAALARAQSITNFSMVFWMPQFMKSLSSQYSNTTVG